MTTTVELRPEHHPWYNEKWEDIDDQIDNLAQKALSAMRPRDAFVVKAKLYEKKTFRSIAEQLGVSLERTRQLFWRGLYSAMKRMLTQEEYKKARLVEIDASKYGFHR